MKKIDTSTLDLSNAFTVSEDQLQNRLLRIDLDTYAFTVTWQHEAVLAFHSRAFSALLNWMETRIVDFAVFRVNCLQNPKDFTFFEVCILGEAGRAFKIDSRGCIEELTAMEEICGEPEGVFLPSERWRIQPQYPYDRLLVSNSLGQSWAKYFDQGSPKELLDHLWHEYTREREDSGPRAVHDLNSEFGPFCAVESVCGRVVFVTTMEGMFVGGESDDR